MTGSMGQSARDEGLLRTLGQAFGAWWHREVVVITTVEVADELEEILRKIMDDKVARESSRIDHPIAVDRDGWGNYISGPES